MVALTQRNKLGGRASFGHTSCLCTFPLSPGLAGIIRGEYQYTQNLLRLETRAGRGQSGTQLPPVVSGFLPMQTWASFLRQHPDQSYAAFLARGLQHSFRIGFNPSSPLWSEPTNRQSALLQDQVVDRMLVTEVAAGRLVDVSSPNGIHTSPLGLIPKPHQPNKF